MRYDATLRKGGHRSKYRAGNRNSAGTMVYKLLCERIPGYRMTIANALYAINITMEDESERRASGIIGLRDGQIVGGDSFFYYTGIYTADNGRWKGELITHQHTETPGKSPLFGGREVGCGFSGSYSDSTAEVHGTALVGKASIAFRATLRLLVPFSPGPV